MERRAQLSGAKLHARPDAAWRRRALLSLELPGAGHRRPGGSRFRCLYGRDAVRPAQRLLRPGSEARCAALGQRRCARAQEDAARATCGTAQAQGARENGAPASRQPPFDHAGERRRVEVHHRPAHLKNDTLLRALALQPTEHTPIWLMRQAGRYLPEYNATRARAGSFMKLCANPELAAEVSLQPLARFPLDAAILFSDILTIPDAMGLGLTFGEGEGPRFERPLRDERAIGALAAPDPAAELRYVLEAVRQIRRALAERVPLIGFAGSPFTLACYMIEGGASDEWRAVKAMRHARPELLHRVLQVNAQAVTAYLKAQIEAGMPGADSLYTWSGV